MFKEWKKNFKSEFFEKCCQLICDFKPVSKPKYLIKPEEYKGIKVEDLITYKYVESIKKVDLGRNVRTDCGKQECGIDKLKEPDITFSTLDQGLRTFFECKMLGSNAKYISKGLERFVNEDYRFNKMPFYGMLGYVQDNNSASKRCQGLKGQIERKKLPLNLIGSKVVSDSNEQAIFKTRHNTIKSIANDKIEITHIIHFWS